MSLAPGTTLGPYKIVSQLGSGGMGVVYTATDPRLDRRVAIKLLPPDLTRDETAKQRFLQEAKESCLLWLQGAARTQQLMTLSSLVNEDLSLLRGGRPGRGDRL